MRVKRTPSLALLLIAMLLSGACSTPVRINHLQFVGSHNSYKQAMPAYYAQALEEQN